MSIIEPPSGLDAVYEAGPVLALPGQRPILRTAADVGFALRSPKLKAAIFSGSVPPQHHLFADAYWAMDGPRHGILKGIAQPYFTGEALDTVMGEVGAIFEHLIVAAIGRSGDTHSFELGPLVRSVSFQSVCALTGLPADQEAWIQEVVNEFVMRMPPFGDLRPEPADVRPYLAQVVANRAALGIDAPDDLLTQLIRARDGKLVDLLGPESHISEHDLYAYILMYFGAGGHTLAAAIVKLIVVLGELGLLEEAGRRAHSEVLAGETDPVLTNLIDEIDRLVPVFLYGQRTAAETVELPSGYVLEAGTPVLLSFAAANRDPSVFPTPNQLVRDRDNHNRSRTFGGGAHLCTGREFAMRAQAVALRKLLVLLGRMQIGNIARTTRVIDTVEATVSW